jgi:hypothetical protein
MAGTWTVGHPANVNLAVKTPGVVRLKYVGVADAADASFPDQAIILSEGILTAIKTVPGGTPTTSGATDVTLEDVDGVDVLGGAGLDLVTTANQTIKPLVGAVYDNIPFSKGLTLKIANNAVNSGELTIVLICVVI